MWSIVRLAPLARCHPHVVVQHAAVRDARGNHALGLAPGACPVGESKWGLSYYERFTCQESAPKYPLSALSFIQCRTQAGSPISRRYHNHFFLSHHGLMLRGLERIPSNSLT